MTRSASKAFTLPHPRVCPQGPGLWLACELLVTATRGAWRTLGPQSFPSAGTDRPAETPTPGHTLSSEGSHRDREGAQRPCISWVPGTEGPADCLGWWPRWPRVPGKRRLGSTAVRNRLRGEGSQLLCAGAVGVPRAGWGLAEVPRGCWDSPRAREEVRTGVSVQGSGPGACSASALPSPRRPAWGCAPSGEGDQGRLATGLRPHPAGKEEDHV